MALWKPFRGSRADLDAVAKHDGYVYFCDDGALFFDYVDANNVLQRKQISAKEAETIMGASLATILNSSDAEIPTSKAVLDTINEKVTRKNLGIYVQATEPEDAPVGTFWIDTSVANTASVEGVEF